MFLLFVSAVAKRLNNCSGWSAHATANTAEGVEWIQWNGVALQLVNNQAALSQEHAHPPLLLLPRRWKEARNEEGEEEGLTRLEEIRRAQLQPLLSVIALSCSILTTVTLTSRVCARSQCKAMQQVVRNLPPRRRAAPRRLPSPPGTFYGFDVIAPCTPCPISLLTLRVSIANCCAK